MRPGNQSNKRMRGRGRKGPNPLTRTYESNGPDVKIRGTAQHVADKYQQLARDAQASGDRVMGENYLQHAEHYLRIIAAAQPPQQPSQYHRQDGEEGAEQSANGAGGLNGERQRPERGERHERTERPERTERANGDGDDVVGEDSPQPFIESMPTIDPAGQVNGQASNADAAEASDDGDEAEKPRRRTRVARGRPRKSEAPDEAAASEETAVEAQAEDGEEPVKKPRARRTPRPRRPKVAEEVAEAEAVPASE